jgi:hypothetical protein
MVVVPASGENHEKTKPSNDIKTNTRLVVTNWIICYQLFVLFKYVKLWKLFLHLFDLVLVNVHISHMSKQKFRLPLSGTVSDLKGQ